MKIFLKIEGVEGFHELEGSWSHAVGVARKIAERQPSSDKAFTVSIYIWGTSSRTPMSQPSTFHRSNARDPANHTSGLGVSRLSGDLAARTPQGFACLSRMDKEETDNLVARGGAKKSRVAWGYGPPGT
jgi:hypothetical protein